ncbi:hypothetical protein F511_14437 [Dorcoceras hygrometricum]|uniref:COP9 signalosome complex subunit 5 n=1 Tax=Dorcoceras hygrometricum TaxID=472368 RepID=A0A2Z7CKN6_9LAMI|nr:hypothetical protein F511_14437 [Dorcoceras hygrometricum]
MDSFSSEAIARQTWELENNIISASATDSSAAASDAIFFYDSAAQEKFQQEKPWANDPHYFKRGKTDGDAIIVMDAFALPVEGTETRVNAQADAYEYMVEYSQTNKQAGRLENVVGWYHSHPGYGCWLSGIDVSTQMLNQQFQEPFLAVVIDPTRTISAGKVEIGAFRTYPEGYKPPDEPVSEYQTIPLNKIEDFGVHCKQYYSLDITYFKSSLDSHLLDLLWNKYWVNTLSSSPLLGNGDYVAGQISDLAAPQRKKEEESQLNKITRDSAKITVEQVHGLMSQVIKDILFNSVCQCNRSGAESSGPEPMVETMASLGACSFPASVRIRNKEFGQAPMISRRLVPTTAASGIYASMSVATKPHDLVESILAQVMQTDRGVLLSRNEHQTVADVANQLQRFCVAEPTKCPLIFGEWDVQYCSNPTSPGGGYRNAFGRLIFKTTEMIQVIESPDTVKNRVSFSFLGFLDGEVSLKGKLTALDGEWVRVVFEPPELKVGGWEFKYGGESEVKLQITYIDDKIRLGKGSRGSLFVFKRREPLP